MRIIRSKRKTLALEIDSNACLIIRAPKLMPVFVIKKFIQQKQNWIIKKQKLIKQRNKQIELTKKSTPKISKNKVYKIISQRVKYYSSISNLKYNKINITNAKKRWGSCNAKNNLNFPLRLASASEKIIDYVVVHELCHIKEKNHSKKFWNKVQRLMPDYKKHRKWLKDKGYLLS